MSKRTFRPLPSPATKYPTLEQALATDRRRFLAGLGAALAGALTLGAATAARAAERGGDEEPDDRKRKKPPKKKETKRPVPVPGGPRHPQAELDKRQD